jgi:Transcriptional Coactivator p15 (PC4)
MTTRPTLPERIPFRFFKNRRKDVIAVTLQTYTPPNGAPLNVVDVRMFAMTKDGRNVPTPKGVSMSVRRLRDLHEAVGKALARAESLGLFDGADDDDPAAAP